MFFSEAAGRLFEPAAGGRVPARAEKSVCAREAEGQAAGRFSFGTFLCAKEKYTDKREKKNDFSENSEKSFSIPIPIAITIWIG